VADPSAKDVVIAMFGASAALGGLVLVFLGLVIASYQSVPADAPKSVKARARRAGPPIVVVFALSLASVGLSLAWLAASGGDLLYHIAIWVFAAELLALFGLAVGMTWKLLS
jgi:uncharacterized membrane protein